LTECRSKTVLMKKEEGREAQKSKKGKKLTDRQHITCYGCGKKGHYQSECPESNDEEEEESDIANLTFNGQGIVLMMFAPTINLPSMTWIADLGALTHITNDERGDNMRSNDPKDVVSMIDADEASFDNGEGPSDYRSHYNAANDDSIDAKSKEADLYNADDYDIDDKDDNAASKAETIGNVASTRDQRSLLKNQRLTPRSHQSTKK